jgi:amidase
MATWIHRFDLPDPVPQGVTRIAVKDAIDVAGVVTTAGCVAVRDRALPAQADAACLAGVRAAAALIVGKTTLTELCLGPEGVNPEFGTPVNPLAPQCIPGGSSSGSAVAVAAGEADIGLGTDTGGSIRIPAACCGIVGLKTTWGRVPTSGVWPLAPSLDTVGPLARTVAGVVAGMRMITPDWRPAPQAARAVGRLRLDDVDRDAEDVIDKALHAAGFAVREVRLPGWETTGEAFHAIILGELWREHGDLLDAEGVSGTVNERLRRAVGRREGGMPTLARRGRRGPGAGGRRRDADAGCTTAVTHECRRQGHPVDAPDQFGGPARYRDARTLARPRRAGQPATLRTGIRRRTALRDCPGH